MTDVVSPYEETIDKPANEIAFAYVRDARNNVVNSLAMAVERRWPARCIKGRTSPGE